MSNTSHHPAIPAPAGLVAFAAGCYCFGAIHGGLIEGNPLPLLCAWLACTIALVTWTPCYYKLSNGVMAIAVTGADIALIVITIKDLGFAIPSVIAGVALFIAGTAALYMAAAIQINAAFEKTILPVPGPWIK